MIQVHFPMYNEKHGNKTEASGRPPSTPRRAEACPALYKAFARAMGED